MDLCFHLLNLCRRHCSRRTRFSADCFPICEKGFLLVPKKTINRHNERPIKQIEEEDSLSFLWGFVHPYQKPKRLVETLFCLIYTCVYTAFPCPLQEPGLVPAELEFGLRIRATNFHSFYSFGKQNPNPLLPCFLTGPWRLYVSPYSDCLALGCSACASFFLPGFKKTSAMQRML
jgi:hypothetical protein